MTDNRPTDRPETRPGGTTPNPGGSSIGDRQSAAGTAGIPPAAAVPATAVPASGSTTTTGMPGSSGSTGSTDGGSGSHGTADTAKEEAGRVGESAKDAGRHVADTAKSEAKNVAGEAKQQARQLWDQSMHEVSEQAKSQQHRAAEGMHTIGDDLRGMAEGADSGLAAQLVSEVGDRADKAARWLDDREPADLLDEVKSFARRRPGTFIAIAGVAGLLVGRLARGIIGEAKDEREQQHASSTGMGTSTGTSTSTSSHAGIGHAQAPSSGQPVQPGGATRGVAVDGGVPAQTGHSPSGTGMPTTRRDGGL